MPNNDMLVKLYQLGDGLDVAAGQPGDIVIRKPIGPEGAHVIEWVGKHFSAAWKSELQRALWNTPATCFVAQREDALVAFACYDATARGYFGPLGVLESMQGQGIGRAITLSCLMDMRLNGYGYAIIGMATAQGFYKKVAGAEEIPDSSPGIYRHFLRLDAPKQI